MNGKKLNYDDIVIVPEVISTISSRSECDCFVNDDNLPIFASPMSTVIDEKNWRLFHENGINAVIPRTISLDNRNNILIVSQKSFVAYSLEETKQIFLDEKYKNEIFYTILKLYPFNICIDIANGHMSDIFDVVKKLKEKYGEYITIMAGNIANPETYKYYDEVGCDYVRVSIGTGDACLTSSNTGIHYPIFSLLKEIYEVKKSINGKCKIIADGGIRGYRDVQKALIYADYVMIGGLFNKAIESAGKTTYGRFYWNIFGRRIIRPIKTLIYYNREVKKKDYDKVLKQMLEGKVDVWKEFYGMSTKKAQKAIMDSNGLNRKLKTSEGIVTKRKVEYSLESWVKNEIDYLKSAMSYTNSRTLDEYKESKWVVVNGIKYNK